MVTVEEKIALFKEVGLSRQANKLIEEENRKKIVEKITALNFKKITEEEIRGKLCSKQYESEFTVRVFKSFLSSFSCTFGGDWGGCHHKKEIMVKEKRYPKLDSMNLDSWEYSIPYGAALALKEAKEAGLKHFKIFFPSTEKGFLRRHDPVVVGFASEERKSVCGGFGGVSQYHAGLCSDACSYMVPTGSMFEIFSWDDGQIVD